MTSDYFKKELEDIETYLNTLIGEDFTTWECQDNDWEDIDASGIVQ